MAPPVFRVREPRPFGSVHGRVQSQRWVFLGFSRKGETRRRVEFTALCAAREHLDVVVG